MGEPEEFSTLAFEKKLMQLKDTQESIQGLSSWCLKQRAHHKRIVSSWLNVLKRVKIEQRLVLFYLANDVIQYSKRKNYEFVESWGLNLQKATPLVRDEKVRPKIVRIFKIWEQRSVYDDEFLSDLTGLLSAGAVKKTDDDPLDFQPQQLVNKIKQCQVLESDTDQRLSKIHEYPLELDDADALCAGLKERCLKEDVEKELAEGVACVERYSQALQREIVARETLLALLSSANQYYSTQRGEVKVVAYAYKNFGSRVRALKRKLDELTPTLPNAAPSPPARDEDVPSPGPDEDIDLPAPNDNNDGDDDIAYNIDRTFNSSLAADGSLYNLGLSSFLTSDNPMSLFADNNDITSSNKIEVINSRPNEKQDMSILNEFLKTLTNDNNQPTSDNNSVTSGTLSQKSQDTLPGLDLLTPESTGNPPPPTSFYGSMDHINDEPEQPYHPESVNTWSTSNWSVPTAVPPPSAPTLLGARLDSAALLGPRLEPGALLGPRLDPPGALLGPRLDPPGALLGPRLDPPGALLGTRLDTPESPPHAPPAPAHAPLVYPPPEIIPAVDVDHRGILPPPPPPPALPSLGLIEDVDHRMLPLPPAPPLSTMPIRHSVHQNQDVDHRNLISLTHQPLPVPRPMKPINLDQDYRVPTMVPPVLAPSDIVESVDMDLSEDEDQQGMYGQQNQDHPRRHSFNNNKVLVGGDNGKKIHEINTNLIEIHSEKKEPQSAPAMSQMVNPFDAMPPSLQRLTSYSDSPEDNEDAYDEDLRSRGLENEQRSPENDWHHQRQYTNQRYPRNWTPRTFRPQGFGPQQFWPRNGPRPPRWAGSRPQRFW